MTTRMRVMIGGMADVRKWGVDLGGTKIEGVVLEGTETVARLRIATEANLGYDHILGQIRKLMSELSLITDTSLPEKVGFGTPGTMDPTTGLMKNCNTTSLNGRPLKRDLAEMLGREVRLANDANCFALAEATLGTAKGYETVFGVILGTGVGGGIVVDGRVLNGAHGIAGEWGHNELEPGGQPCYCGRSGCVETVLSGPFLERYYQGLTSETKRLPEIFANLDDPAAQSTLDRLTHYFGRGIATIINILDPHAIVLGGGVGNVEALYTVGVQEVKKHVFNDRLETQILRPTLGDSAGVFGAAMLV